MPGTTDRTYLIDLPADAGGARWGAAFAAYREHIEAIRGALPANALAYAEAAWHYDIEDHRCPHDSWLEELTVIETGSGERSATRSLELRAVLLGAYHDGRIHMRWPGLSSYTIEQPPPDPRFPDRGHGDWLCDEVTLAQGGGAVLHQVTFSEHARWTIVAADIVYEWRPGDSPSTGSATLG